MGLVVELPELERIAREVEAALDEVEDRLLRLLQDGAGSTRPLPDVIQEFVQLAAEIRPQHRRVHEILGRRDLSFAAASRLGVLQKRAIWLYRKCRLEHIFFSKLQLERSLRETLYRETVETWQQMSALEDEERILQTESDSALAGDLLGDSDERSGSE